MARKARAVEIVILHRLLLRAVQCRQPQRVIAKLSVVIEQVFQCPVVIQPKVQLRHASLFQSPFRVVAVIGLRCPVSDTTSRVHPVRKPFNERKIDLQVVTGKHPIRSVDIVNIKRFQWVGVE